MSQPADTLDAHTKSEPVLQVRELNVSYHSQVALSEVSLDIPPRSIFACIGPSGCGKTSFLQAINRLTDLIPGCQVTGEIRLGGQNVLSPEADVLTLRRRVGMIFQKPNPFPFSILENLLTPLREHGYRRGEMAALAEAALTDVGLWNEVKDRLHNPAPTLSGGQQQRLCIARALALEPQLLLLDEPTSALDPLAAEVVETLLKRLAEKLTLVVVTHNLAQARRLADRAALFWLRDGGGRVVEAGPAEQIFQQPQHELTMAYVRGERG